MIPNAAGVLRRAVAAGRLLIGLVAGIVGTDSPLVLVSFARDEVRGMSRETGLNTEDARHAHALHIVLTRRGDILTGTLTAWAPASDHRQALSQRRGSLGFALTHWVEMRRAPAAM